MRNLFRIIAFLEGMSYILLLFIAVPLKYWGGDEQYVKLLGMPHGLLFVGYIILAFLMRKEERWNNTELFIVLICSVLPFGTFYIDKKYLKK
jgi:integral membrane protein